MARIYLGMPTYGGAEPAAMQAFYQMASREHETNAVAITGSLLGNVFNRHWCNAINGGYDYFAMLHGDVVPEPYWLDRLHDILCERGVDLVSTVVPIKTAQGITSTGIDDPDNPWQPLLRLTMTQVMRLPETFTSVDCGHPDKALLVNTGCWLANLKGDWQDKVLFTIRDAIGRNAQGQLVALVEPEDWCFSRQLHRLGVRYCATRAVKVKHRGMAEYPNDRTWGTVSVDPMATTTAGQAGENDGESGANEWLRISTIRGWLTRREYECLIQHAEGVPMVLEIGSFAGRSTVALARAANLVVSVDHHRGDAGTGPADTYEEFLGNLRRFGVRRKVLPLRGDIRQIADVLPSHRFGMVFIDGAHDEASVTHDLGVALRCVSPGGLIALHDSHYPSVQVAMNTHGLKALLRVDSLAIVG